MPRRPESHQLETRSILAFRNVLPPSWVFREEHPDYGIDGTLELFEEGRATGLRCFVQLKATARARGRPKVQLRKETADYFKSLQLPVLIVFYEADRHRLLVRWFHEFDPYYGGLGKKTITFSFSLGDAWSDTTPSRLRRDLEIIRTLAAGALPLPIPFELIVNDQRIGGKSRSEVITAVRRRLRNYRTLLKEQADGALWIRIENEKTVVSFRGRHSATLHTGNPILQVEEFSAGVVLLVAVVVRSAGDHNLTATLASSVGGESRLLEDPEIFFRVTDSMVRSQQAGKALELADQLLISDTMRTQADLLLVSALLPQHESASDAARFETHLLNRIQIEQDRGDAVQLGTAYYNYGRYLSGRSRFRESLRHYRLAAEHHPGYRGRDYYWREIGSLLFGAGFYRASARYYAKAVAAGGPLFCKALYADALMFAGSFDESRRIFAEYLKDEPKPEGEWVIKHWALGIILGLDRSTDGRQQLAAHRMLSMTPLTSVVAMEAIHLDPLCAPAWLKYAKTAGEEIDHQDRNGALIIAAAVAQKDPWLWAQAFLHVCSSRQSDDLGGWIAMAAFHAVGDEFNDSIRVLASEGGASEEDLACFLDSVRELEAVCESLRRPETFEMRVAGPGAEYETIKIPLDHTKSGETTASDDG